MKKNTPIEELKRGDKIFVQYGFSKHKAKVIANQPDEKKILLRICFINFLGLWLSTSESVFKYSEHEFKDYEMYNYRN